METSDIVTIVLTIIGTLGGAGAWNYYQRRLELSAEDKKREIEESHVYRDDLRERVAVLESKLKESHEERDKLMQQLSSLASETAALRVEVKYLRDERDRLLDRLEEFLREN